MMHDELMIPSVQEIDQIHRFEYMVLLAKHAWSATPVTSSFDWRWVRHRCRLTCNAILFVPRGRFENGW